MSNEVKPSIAGEQRGLDVLKKLRNSLDERDIYYYKSVANAAKLHGTAWFSDISEQRKKVFANLPVYCLSHDSLLRTWKVELFMELKHG